MALGDYINKIRNAVYGKDVRKAIADGLESVANKQNEAIDIANKAKIKAGNAENRVSNIIAQSGTSDTEVVDMRTDINGKVYSVAKERVDAIELQLEQKVSQQALNIEKGRIDIIGDRVENTELSLVQRTAEVASLQATKADKIALDLERQRINAIATLPNGSTTGDAELIDSRVAFDGTSHANAGTHIRTITEAIAKQSLYTRTPTTAQNSMDDLTNFGIYAVTTTTTPYDSPVPATSGIVVVMQYNKSNNPALGNLIQTFYTRLGVYYRFKTTTTWGPWLTFHNTPNFETRKANRTVAKMQQKFTPLETIPASSPTDDNPQTFVAGTEYIGVPYSSVHQYERDCFYNLTPDTVLSMFKNPDSPMYDYQSDRSSAKLYAGAVCSSYVSWFCNQPVFYTTVDMQRMLEFKNYVDIEDLEIGDVLVQDGHSAVVSGFLELGDGSFNILVSEMWMPLFRTMVYTPESFRNYIKTGNFQIGRFPNQGKLRTLAVPNVVDDCISERGDNTFYKLGEKVLMMIKGNNFSYKAPDSNIFVTVDKSTLPTETKKGVQYNITSLLNKVGIWEFKSSLSGNKVSKLAIYKPGTATLANGKVTLSGYEGCTPYAYRVVRLHNDPNFGEFDAPSGYSAVQVSYDKTVSPQYMGLISGTEFDVNVSKLPALGAPGYYVRVLYETGCGRAYQNSNIVWF